MSTSLGDLLDALDAASRSPDLTAGDSANALLHVATALTWTAEHIRNHKLNQPVPTDVTALAGEVASNWPHEAGRCTELAGVIADVIGLHAPGLNHADAAQTTLSLVTTARRFALTVERTAATDDTTLEELIGACNDFRRLAARSPTPTRRTEWLHRPFALSAFDAEALPAAERCQESVAGLVDYLYMHSRNPLTSRQILAVSRVAEVIATRLETLAEEPGSQNAAGWGRLRRQLLLVSDGHADHAQFGNARLMQHAADAHRAIEQVDTRDLSSPSIQAVAASLPMIATRLERDLHTARPWLLAPPGDQPLHVWRTREWMRGTTYKVEAQDLGTTFDLLRRLQRLDVATLEANGVSL